MSSSSTESIIAEFKMQQLQILPNTNIWCPKMTKTRSISKLDADECISCEDNFENGGFCDPLMKDAPS